MSEKRLHEHLRRFGWVYGLSLLLMLLPIGLWRGYVVKPLPEAEVERARQAVARAFERAHPELHTTTTLPRLEQWKPKLNAADEQRQNWLLEMQRVAPQVAVLHGELDWLGQTYDPILQRMDELARRGIGINPFRQASDAESTSSQEVLAYQTYARVQRMLAERAMDAGRWDEALRRLEALGRSSNLVRDQQLIGQMFAIAVRAIAYGSYASLLQVDPPPEVLNSALQALKRLQASEPAMDCWTMLGVLYSERNYVQRANQKQPRWYGLSPADYRKVLLQLTTLEYALRAGDIKTPRLRAWGEKQARRFQSTRLKNNGPLMLANDNALEWTAAPAAIRWLREVAEHEPELCHAMQLDLPELADLDPLCRMELLTSPRETLPNVVESLWRARVMQTQGRLVAAALAMRLYRAEHGEWPETAEAPGFAWLDATTTETGPVMAVPPARPFWPLHMGWVTLDDAETSFALWNQRLPIRELMQRPPMRLRETTTVTGRSLASSWPGDGESRSPQAFREAFTAHPALVTSTTLRTNRMAAIVKEALHPQVFAGLPEAAPAPVADEPDEDKLVLTIQLQAPARAQAVWSAGPDGVDDGGRMQYDPTNGTYSRGDQVIFPERF